MSICVIDAAVYKNETYTDKNDDTKRTDIMKYKGCEIKIITT